MNFMIKFKKVIAIGLLFALFFQILFPVTAFALTGGPTQPEVTGFTPITATDMVNTFTGDMSYNLPLLDIEGYPINLAYQSGISMDQEASWVGLGWSLNPGVINRNLRGIPDDFGGGSGSNQDVYEKILTNKNNLTVSLSTGIDFRLGAEPKPNESIKGSLGGTLTVKYNTYQGVGVSLGSDVGYKLGNVDLNASIQYDNSNGMKVNGGLSLSYGLKDKDDLISGNSTLGLSTGYSSRSGAVSLSLSSSSSVSTNKISTRLVNPNAARFGMQWNSAVNTVNHFTPYIANPMTNWGIALSFSVGGKIPFIPASIVNGSLSGSVSNSKVAQNRVLANVYGYIYHDRALMHEYGIQDFQREKDGTFASTMKNLPLAHSNFDFFVVNGHGTGGSFRPHRSFVGRYGDPTSKILRDVSDIDLGATLSFGKGLEVGGKISVTDFKSSSGIWKNTEFDQIAPGIESGLPTNVVFKTDGELTPNDDSWFDKLGRDKSIRFEILNDPENPKLLPNSLKYNNNTYLVNPKFNRNGLVGYPTEIRNNLISVFTAEEASISGVGLNPTIRNYYPNDPSIGHSNQNNTDVENNLNYETIERIGTNKRQKGHHISQIVQTKEDGSRYVFGIPALNIVQIEKQFSVDKPSSNSVRNGLVDYDNNDETQANVKGRDNYFSQTLMPAYSHSYLLTSILSNDYVDVNQDGISNDDLGTYVKFNYSRTSSNYGWRTPYEAKKANYQAGMNVDDGDDKAIISAGIKELWYLNSIETKNQILLFYISPRKDAVGANVGIKSGTNPVEYHTLGGKPVTNAISNEQRSMRLDSIVVYSKLDGKSEYDKKNPLKRIYFAYDYSLCPGIPNFENIPNQKHLKALNNQIPQTGKLTLKEVWIAYGNSSKGLLSPYRFNYSNKNSSYAHGSYDRWGQLGDFPANLTGVDFPYVTKDRNKYNELIQHWNLTEVILPSGGKIEVKYEGDDYAFVQDKRAMQMFLMEGAGYRYRDGLNGPIRYKIDGNLYETNKGGLFGLGERKFDLVYFDLTKTFNDLEASGMALNEIKRNEIWRKRMLGDIDMMYFSLNVNVSGLDNIYEQVTTYCKIDASDSGVIFDQNKQKYIGYVKIKDDHQADYSSDRISGLAKAVWTWGKTHYGRYMNRISNPNNSSGEDIFFTLFGVLYDIVDQFNSASKTLINQNAGQSFFPSKSWARLYTPNGKKNGGGLRVSEVKVYDEWQNIASSSTAVGLITGQKYIYETFDPVTDQMISSGVASYEPGVGGDENPLRKPIFYTSSESFNSPRGVGYLEEPFGENAYPNPVVGYSKVRIEDINKQNSLSAKATKEIEYYTSADFPVITEHTNIDEISYSKDPKIYDFFEQKTIRHYAGSQGYLIITNDMHGKIKAERTLRVEDDKESIIKETRYEYQVDSKNKKRLDGYVDAIFHDGTKRRVCLGRTTEFNVDTRSSSDFQRSTSYSVDISLELLGFLPYILAPTFSTTNITDSKFHSVVFTKIIQQSGILQKTIVKDDESMVTTEHVLYDGETGDVLVKTFNNEFNDSFSDVKIPAYWVYDRMGPAYRNDGFTFKSTFVPLSANYKDRKGNLLKFPSAPRGFIRVGDEVLVSLPGSQSQLAWVSYVIPCDVLSNCSTSNPLDYVALIDKNGHWFTEFSAEEHTFKVVRSGSKNQLKDPLLSAVIKGKLTDLNSIVTLSNNLSSSNDIQNALTASLVVYDDSSKINYNLDELFHNPSVVFSNLRSDKYINPFLTGLKSVFTPKYTLEPVVSRDYQDNQLNSKNAGLMLQLKSPVVRLISGNINASNPSYPNILELTRRLGILSSLDWNGAPNNSIQQGWFKKETVTRRGADLKAVEVINPLNIFSSEHYGYERKLVTASANNSGYNQFGFDGFEDYPLADQNKFSKIASKVNVFRKLAPPLRILSKCFNCQDFNIDPNTDNNCILITNKERHSGKYSMMIFNEGQLLYLLQPTTFRSNEVVEYDNNQSSASKDGPYRINLSGVTGFLDGLHIPNPYKFNFTKRYNLINNHDYMLSDIGYDQVLDNRINLSNKMLLSFWIKSNVQTLPTIKIKNVLGSEFDLFSGQVKYKEPVEGWRKIEIVFDLSNVQSQLDLNKECYLEIKGVIPPSNSQGNEKLIWYVDDLRIQPEISSMKSFVYDLSILKPSAILDENNYATFYEYDLDGSLIRIKKETERGILTVKENRKAIKK